MKLIKDNVEPVHLVRYRVGPNKENLGKVEIDTLLEQKGVGPAQTKSVALIMFHARKKWPLDWLLTTKNIAHPQNDTCNPYGVRAN